MVHMWTGSKKETQEGSGSRPRERLLLTVSPRIAPSGSCAQGGVCLRVQDSEFSVFLESRLYLGKPHQWKFYMSYNELEGIAGI